MVVLFSGVETDSEEKKVKAPSARPTSPEKISQGRRVEKNDRIQGQESVSLWGSIVQRLTTSGT